MEMNAAHLHLILNHFPVLGTLFGIPLFGFALVRRSRDLMQASCGLFVLVAILAVPVYLFGEPAEEVVEHLAGVRHALIERHETWAAAALAGAAGLGLLGLIGLFILRRTPVLPTWLLSTTTVVLIITAGILVWTANLGGQIRHTEIRAGASSQVPAVAKQHQ